MDVGFFFSAGKAVIVLEHLSSHSFQNTAVQMQTLVLIMKGIWKRKTSDFYLLFFFFKVSILVEVWPISI